MRVLLVNDYPPRAGSGAEVHLLRLARGLEAAGDAVEVFTRAAPRKGVARALDLWDPVSRAALRRRVQVARPDVVHFHNVVRELSASVLGAPGRAGRVLTLHDLRLMGVPDGPAGHPFDHALVRRLKMAKARVERAIAYRAIDVVIAPTRATARLLADAGFVNVHVIPHFATVGPDPSILPSGCSDVVVAGRLSSEKGVDVLLEAFARIVGRHPAAALLILGEGPHRGHLEELAARLPSGRVRFMGLLDEDGVRRAMGQARVVVAPSLAQEVAGLTVVEAALAGRPVIVSDDPAQRELVDEGGCGIVTPRGDVAALAEALDRLLADGALADRLGASGRATAGSTRSVEAGVARTRLAYEAAIIRRAESAGAPGRPRPRNGSRRVS